MSGSIVQSSSPSLVGQPNVAFRKNDFDAAIWNKGYDVIIEKAVRCPCVTRDGSAYATCNNCLGMGWFFINPLKTRAILTSINKDTKYKNWSEELLGTIAVTVRDTERLVFMDKITLYNNSEIDNTSIFQEILKVRDLTGTPFVFASYKPVNIIGIYVFNGASEKLIKLESSDYSISSNNPYVIEFSYDFSVISDYNEVISLYYEHEIQYHVLDLPHDVRSTIVENTCGRQVDQNLPIHGIARKAHNVFELKNRLGTDLHDNSDDDWIERNVITPC